MACMVYILANHVVGLKGGRAEEGEEGSSYHTHWFLRHRAHRQSATLRILTISATIKPALPLSAEVRASHVRRILQSKW